MRQKIVLAIKNKGRTTSHILCGHRKCTIINNNLLIIIIIINYCFSPLSMSTGLFLYDNSRARGFFLFLNILVFVMLTDNIRSDSVVKLKKRTRTLCATLYC